MKKLLLIFMSIIMTILIIGLIIVVFKVHYLLGVATILMILFVILYSIYLYLEDD